MIAPALDTPSFQSTATGHNRRLEWVSNTPYNKFNEDSRFYIFSNGFYYSRDSVTSHPIVELQKNVDIQKAQTLTNRAAQVVSSLESINLDSAIDVLTATLWIILNNDFHSVTFEKTPENSCLIKMNWAGKNVYLEIYFDSEDDIGYEAILTAYEKREQVVSVAGSLNFVFNELSSSCTNDLVRI